MAKYGSSSVTINVDDSGGVARAMTDYVRSEVLAEIESILTESHAFGDSFVEHLAVGLKRMSPLEFEGFYDDTATTGPHVVFSDLPTGPSSITKTVTIVWGGGKSVAVETLINKYTRRAVPGALTMFKATATPTGTITEA